jgi:hypothetical protein
MTDLELRLDGAIDRLNAGAEPAAGAAEGLNDLLDLARAVQALPAGEWPDESFPARLAAALAGELAPPVTRTAGSRSRRRLPRLRLGIAVAATAAAVAVAAVVSLDRSPPVGAATLAREALAAGSGRTLGPIRFTEVVTSRVPRGSFEPAPPPPRVVEQIAFAAIDRWRVRATITEPDGEGTATVLTVRNGDTIVTRTTSPVEGTTETRRAAGAAAGLPGASAYGALIDPLALLAEEHGRCARAISPVTAGPTVAGRPTQLLRIGASPCPSAAMPELDGPATFVIDRRTHLVLRAELHAASGRLSERVTTTALTAGGPIPAAAFRLPGPLPKTPAVPGTAFAPRLPTAVPHDLKAGPITPVETQASTGKALAFTVTYADRRGRAQLQLYEAAAGTPSVRFPGRTVTIRPGLTGTYVDQGGLRILWWTDDGVYFALQQGGAAAGVPLLGSYPLGVLLRLAASTS